MRLAAILTIGFGFAACQPAQPTRIENSNIAVDPKGDITLNGEPITQEQLKTHLENATATIIVETDGAGKSTVTLNGRKMTAEEFADYKRRQRQR